MYQDTDGNMWFGTIKGVSVYDGNNWTTYTTSDGLANNSVNFIMQDSAGTIWIATQG